MRGWLATGVALLLALPMGAQAQKLETTKVRLAVGGKSSLYYLPLTITERLGYFKEAGLDVEITAIDLSQCSVKFKQGTLEWRPPRQLDIGALEDRPSPRLDALIEQARLGLQQRGTR